MAPHGDAEHAHGHLEAAQPGRRPDGAARQTGDRRAEVERRRGSGVRRSEEDVEVVGRHHQAVVDEQLRSVDHAQLQDLELRLDAAREHPFGERRDDVRAVDRRAVVEVERAGGEAGEVRFGLPVEVEDRRPVLELAVSPPARRRADDQLRPLLTDAADDLGEDVGIVGRLAFSVAGVDMDHGSADVVAQDGVGDDLLGAQRHVRALAPASGSRR